MPEQQQAAPPTPWRSLPTVIRETVLQVGAGTVAGMSGIAAGQPFDTVKVRLQAGRQYSGALDCTLSLLRKEGPRGFFKGMTAPLIGNAPINAILFAVEHRASVLLQQYAADWSSSSRHLLAGAISGLSQVIISCPAERVKILLQTQVTPAPGFESPWLCARTLVQTAGLRSLFRGWWLTVARDAPAFALYFYSYDRCKSWFMHRAQLKGKAPSSGALMGPVPLMLSGGMAGLISWAFLHPIDVMKTMYQRVPHTTAAKDARFLAVMRAAHKEQGLRFLGRGFLPTCLRAFPASAVTFLVYEWCVWLGVQDTL